jgi:hypothetical protein
MKVLEFETKKKKGARTRTKEFLKLEEWGFNPYLKNLQINLKCQNWDKRTFFLFPNLFFFKLNQITLLVNT